MEIVEKGRVGPLTIDLEHWDGHSDIVLQHVDVFGFRLTIQEAKKLSKILTEIVEEVEDLDESL